MRLIAILCCSYIDSYIYYLILKALLPVYMKYIVTVQGKNQVANMGHSRQS